MGDDIRDRFRGGRTDYSGPIRPSFQPPKQPQPTQPRLQPQANTATVNVFGQPMPKPAQPRSVPRPSAIRPVSEPKARRRGKKISPKKWLFAVLALFILGGGGAAAYSYKFKSKPVQPVASNQESLIKQAVAKPTGTIIMLVTGDFYAYDTVNAAAKTATGYDYSPLMAPMKPIMDKYDIRFCSQATLGGGIDKGVSGYPTFNAPTEWSKALEDLGCNLINVGSNHTNDKGQEAINSALAHYDSNKNILAINGANRSTEEQARIRYFTLKQVKFAYLSYTTTSQKPPDAPFSINLYNAETAKKQVEEARKEAQFVIVSMNWGKEDSGDVQPEQDTIAQALVTAGADLVVGNGPHIVQPAKILNGANGRQGLVWFSLGNAVNSQLLSDNLFGGIGIVNIDVATQNMTDPGFLPTYMHYEWTTAEKSSGRLEARKNLGWHPLDTAKDLLAKSQNNTTVEAQTERLKGIITKFAPIKILKSTEL